MNKVLVHSEEEFILALSSMEVTELELFLDIEFAYEDGTFQSDLDLGHDIDEDQPLIFSKYRKRSNDCFPTSYPCVVLWAKDEDFDRIGKIAFELLEFVYPSDFEVK